MQAHSGLVLEIPRRSDVLRRHQAAGGAIAAVLPIHSPRALLRAFGYLPVEVWGPPRVDATRGTAHLQPYVCSVVRNALAFLESGGLDVAAVVVVPHACDSLQGLASILIDFVRPRQVVLPFYLPRVDHSAGVDYLTEELRLLHARLAELTAHSPSHDELMACIQREELADGLLVQLHASRSRSSLSSYETYRLLRAREYLPAEDFASLAASVLARVEGPSGHGTPIVLSGTVPEPMELLAHLDNLGGRVAADDLACCSRRLYPTGRSPDPFRRMAESLLGGPPDPTRGSPIPDRLAHLLRLCRDGGARGVIFYEVKFCEPELFDLPLLRRGLQEAGIATVVIEVDLNDPLTQQMGTRLEAFLEMLA